MSLLIASLAPVFIVIVYIYIKDKFEKESKRFLLKNFLLGAFFSVIISLLLYNIYEKYLPKSDEFSVIEQFLKAFFVVALIEEFSKYIIIRYYTQRKKAFNEPFDGIIYAVMVSMGFAAVENIFYVIEGGLSVALLRAFTAIPAHATFAIIMGYYMGKAKFSNNKAKWNLIGLLGAIIFHGSYDFFLFINFIPGIAIGAFVSLLVGIMLSRKAIKLHQLNSFFKEI
ncbi:PrsW family intramembrane metalloprotease [Lutibacter flavus]|uniref:Protease PrsW n=1 Tax=Lutibacter flavus TaxID=691689 RepID=A0A238VBR0_9FLAO|nr:PrsW family glutamic-type intramembrane protease [Lutibacter flavus]SNR31842.1 Membrane proteinase PrsW, cleaves anti-sigma factor RsiW, M82 family [Lutibacter flavus]